MSALTRIDPLEQLLPEMFRRFAQPLRFGTLNAEPTGDIRLDVSETPADYTVRAEIPGAKKEDVRITVDGNFVNIAAEIHRDKEEKADGGRVLLKESYHGSVARGFSLAHEIDAGRVVARFEDGVLRLTLPKREGSASRTIAVQ
ncbi:Hsp20 family protein [Roseateles sp. DAIF2]|uniref:Hsp20/alpha crystallin family protein n=1 Tax=Roseateles sp. DAIF2 TaxID=2714952 RepID=UPI0018A32FD5|nr:Hsp20 family protein [Roseateles sp. DAIF2]QPF73499.1 Hsp20 family protein [Roseateles sp. DAIF2]